MKKYFIILIIFTLFTISCYQEPESLTGSISVNLSTVSKDAPAGYDGELRLAVFPEGLDSLIEDSGFQISYLTELPAPLLANNSVPVNGNSGIVSLLNVPADAKLQLLVEFDRDWNGDYYNAFSGISSTFEVAGGGNSEVTVKLLETANGSVRVNNYTPDPFGMVHFWFFDPDDYNDLITLSGTDITYIDDSVYVEDDWGNVNGAFLEYDAILPGKKYRFMVSEEAYIVTGYPNVGISGTFEVQPGLEKAVSVTYYSYTNCSGYNGYNPPIS